MSLCFAFGKKDRTTFSSDIFTIEYINYKILHDQSDSIDIAADMFFPNSDDRQAIYYFLHRGNLDFKPAFLEKVLAQESFFTSFLKRMYAPSLGCRVEDSGRIIGMVSPNIREINLTDIEMYAKTTSRVDEKDISPIPYNMHEITVPPKSCGYLRIYDTLAGEEFHKLTYGGKCLDVCGGWTLLDIIQREDINPIKVREDKDSKIKKYCQLFNFFFQNAIVPARYDIVLSTAPDTYAIKCHPRTSDLLLGCEDKMFCEKQITWYWSLSPASFLVTSYLKGPNLSVGAKTTKSFSKE
jgi:hypothetical protein